MALTRFLERLLTHLKSEVKKSYVSDYNYAGKNLDELLDGSGIGTLQPSYPNNILVTVTPGSGYVDTVFGIHTQTEVPGNPTLETSEFAYLAHRSRPGPDGSLLFEREAKIRWAQKVQRRDGTLFPPVYPEIMGIEVLGTPVTGLRVADGTPLTTGFDSGDFRVQAGQPIPITMQLEGLAAGGLAQAFVGGQFATLTPDGPNQYSGQISAPAVPGLYQLEMFAFNTRSNGAEQAQSVRGRAVELEVIP